MKATALSAIFTALACAAVLAQDAQTPRTSQSSDKAITVTGCVQRAAAAPTGTSGSTMPSSSEPKFILTSINSSPSSTAGTSGAASKAATEYRLDASDAKLTPHVGHKVEITGTVEQSSSSSSSPSAATSASSSNAPKLKVDDVKMVATSCS